jgi:hypothetical protein
MWRHSMAKSLLLGKRSKHLSDLSMPRWLVWSNCIWFGVYGFFFPFSSLIFMLAFQIFKTTFQFYFLLYHYFFDYYLFYLRWFMKLEFFSILSLMDFFHLSDLVLIILIAIVLFLMVLIFFLQFHYSWVLLPIKFDLFYCYFFYIKKWYFYDFILQHLFAWVFSFLVGSEFII